MDSTWNDMERSSDGQPRVEGEGRREARLSHPSAYAIESQAIDSATSRFSNPVTATLTDSSLRLTRNGSETLVSDSLISLCSLVWTLVAAGTRCVLGLAAQVLLGR